MLSEANVCTGSLKFIKNSQTLYVSIVWLELSQKEFVGAFEGAFVGTLDGAFEGAFVGTLDGAFVGTLDGAFVGE